LDIEKAMLARFPNPVTVAMNLWPDAPGVIVVEQFIDVPPVVLPLQVATGSVAQTKLAQRKMAAMRMSVFIN
jgi:hypothetical protein